MVHEGSAFDISLKILKFYCVYKPVNNKFIQARAIFFQSFIVLHFLVASIYRAFFVTNFDDFIVAIIYVIFSVNLTFKLVTFMIYQRDILKMIEELESLDLQIEKEVVRKDNKSILSLMLNLLVSDLIIGFCLSLSILFLRTKKNFTIPLLYYPENEVAYYLLFALHYFQIYGIGSISHGKSFLLKLFKIFE